MYSYEAAMKYLLPTEEEQAWLILQGKCPHNDGWIYKGHGHNDETYQCRLCGLEKEF